MLMELSKCAIYSEERASDDTLRVLEFPADQAACEALALACQAATFGMNNKDVHDENYRKAGKMDRSEFAIAFDGAMGVSLEKAAKQLIGFSDDGGAEDIEVELYKLNVYGEWHGFL